MFYCHSKVRWNLPKKIHSALEVDKCGVSFKVFSSRLLIIENFYLRLGW